MPAGRLASTIEHLQRVRSDAACLVVGTAADDLVGDFIGHRLTSLVVNRQPDSLQNVFGDAFRTQQHRYCRFPVTADNKPVRDTSFSVQLLMTGYYQLPVN